jgi:hypothetical protein
LLIEEQRTNLLTYSEDFTNAAWTKIGATLTSNSVTAPNGTVTAETLVEDSSTGNHWLFQSGGAAGAYSATVYAKAAGRSWLVFRFTVSGTITYAWFNVSTGTVGTVQAGLTATITSVGDGWYRCSISGTMSAASPIVIGAANADNSNLYTGNSGNALFLWGAQLEAGAFATSYIPTVASQVTRAADSASMIGNNFARWYNQTEGTLYAQFDSLGLTAVFARIFGVSDGTANNRIRTYISSATNIQSTINVGGVEQALLNSTTTTITSGAHKVAVAYVINDFGQSADAGTVATDTSGSTPVVNLLGLGQSELLGSLYLNGHLARFAYYPRRLANTELQGITS